MFKTAISVKVLSALMMLLVLISSIGLSINMHYCGDTLKAVGVFAEAPSCSMMDESECNSDDDCSGHQTIQNSCCSYDLIYGNLSPEVGLDLSVQQENITFDTPIIIINNGLSTNSAIKPVLYLKDKVPRTKDNTVLFQCFII